MVKKYYNKLRMYLAVLKVLMDNEDLWKDLTLFKDDVTEFNSKILLINAKRPQTEQTTVWITEDKSSTKDELVDILLDVSGQLYSIGHRTNNKELMAATDFEESDFKGKDADLPKIAASIVKLARANITALAGLKVTEADIDEIERLAAAFAEKDTEPRAVVSDRKSAGESLVEIYHDADAVLNLRLDKMMKRFRRTNPEFFRTFKNAKMIIDYGIRHEEEIKTASSENGTKKAED